MSTKKLSSATIIVASGMILGRATGLLRELVIASQFGISREADLATLATTIPDMLNTIFIGGAISAVLIPELHRCEQESVQKSNRLVMQFAMIVGLGSLLISLLFAASSRWLVSILAPGFDLSSHHVAQQLVWIVLLAFPSCTLTAVTSAALQARHRITLPAYGPFVFNVVLVIGMLMTSRTVFVVSWLVVVAAMVRWLVQVWGCYRVGIISRFNEWRRRPDLLNKTHFVRYVQTIAAVTVAVCLPVAARAFASQIPGGIASYNYASRLVEVPVGLISSIITMVIFPRISQAIHRKDLGEARRWTLETSAVIVVCAIPLMLGFVAAANLVTSILFQRGQLGSEQVALITSLATIGFTALPATCLTTHAMGICQANGDTKFPFVTSVSVFAIFLPASWLGSTIAGLTGLMWATVSVQWLQCIVLCLATKRRHEIAIFGTISSYRLFAISGVSASFLAITYWCVNTFSWSTWGVFTLSVLVGLIALAASSLLLLEYLGPLQSVLGKLRRFQRVSHASS